jgi:hypothetical protein
MFTNVEDSGDVALQTRGDGDSISEELSVSPRSSLGRLAYRIPFVGTLLDVLNQPVGKALFLGVPCVVLATNFVRRRTRRRPTPVDDARVAALLDAGRRALTLGHPHLALRAAEGALALEPLNREAALLKAQSQAQQAADLGASDVEYVAA